MSLSISHLCDLGHRRLAYLHGIDDAVQHYVRDLNQRRLFYYEELARRALPADPDLVLYGGWSRQDGHRATLELLKRAKPFSAILADDHIVGGVYQALQEADLGIGREVSVVGHGDLIWSAQLHPPLTTIRVSRRRLAERVVGRLQELMDAPGASFPAEEIPVELTVRESTGPCGAGGKS